MSEMADKNCFGCGSPLKYNIFDDIYNCPVCNRNYMLQAEGDLKLIIDRKIEDTNPIAMGTSASSMGERIECPICGKTNPRENTFRCPDCGKAGICLNHQDEHNHLCEICIGEKQRGMQSEIDRAQSYLRELENAPKNNPNKFLSVMKKYSGPDYAREIKTGMIIRNLLPTIAALGSLLISCIGIMKEEFGICTVGFILSIVMSFISFFHSRSTFREIRENEIRQVKEQITEKYRLLRNLSPSINNTWVSPVQYGKVNPAWFQPGWSGGGSVQSYTVEAKKPKSGGCSLTFLEVLFVVAVIVGFFIWANQVYPDWNKDLINSDNPATIFSDPCKVVREKYIINVCTYQEGGGNSRSGYKWCQVDEKDSGDSLHRWIPEQCAK